MSSHLTTVILSSYNSHKPIVVWEGIVRCLIPFFFFIAKNFCFQAICRRILSGYKWQALIGSQRLYVKMREVWRWFRFEISSIKTRTLILNSMNCAIELTNDILVRLSWKNIAWYQMKTCYIHQNNSQKGFHQYFSIGSFEPCSSKINENVLLLVMQKCWYLFW